MAACSSERDGENTAYETPDTPATAVIYGENGGGIGQLTLSEDSNGVTIRMEVERLPEGQHAVHLHTVGRCEAPGFASAGIHWNPTGARHGRDNPRGAHLGDLANIEVGEDGRGSSVFLVSGARIASGELPLVDLDGTALVIHERADDYQTDPDGRSGRRIACGVLPG